MTREGRGDSPKTGPPPPPRAAPRAPRRPRPTPRPTPRLSAVQEQAPPPPPSSGPRAPLGVLSARYGRLLAEQPKYLVTALVPCWPAPPLAARPLPLKWSYGSPRYAPAPAQDALAAAAKLLPAALLHGGVQIVEALGSLPVTVRSGVTQFPAKSWLILGPPPGDKERRSAEELAGAWKWLPSFLGGGFVGEASCRLLQPVAQERLHATAAESNFRRASRGSSVLALEHAAYALDLLQEVEMSSAGTRAPSVSSSVAAMMASPTLMRVEQMRGVVEARAAAAEQRSQMACGEELFGQAGAALPPGQVLLRRASWREVEQAHRPSWLTVGDGREDRIGGKQTLQKGLVAWDEFLSFAKKRFGNFIRAWFKLDPEENMRIGEKSFLRRCPEIGFRGNAWALWRYIDSDRSGIVNMWELDKKSTVSLAQFWVVVQEKFGGRAERAFAALDENHSGWVHKDEFLARMRAMDCAQDLDAPLPQLFDLLDRQGRGSIGLSDMTYLNRWAPPPYLFTKPDEDGLNSLRDSLYHVYGMPMFRSWRKLFDRDGNMRVSWEEFSLACKALTEKWRRQPPLALGERDVAGIFHALDTDCSGWISIREFDPPSHDTLAHFKQWVDETHGNAVRFFRVVDEELSQQAEKQDDTSRKAKQISPQELKQALRKAEYGGDIPELLRILDASEGSVLTERDVKFLDRWELVWEEWEIYHRRKVEEHQTKVRKVSLKAKGSLLMLAAMGKAAKGAPRSPGEAAAEVLT